jgi:Protein of unknown function (DUF2975)
MQDRYPGALGLTRSVLRGLLVLNIVYGLGVGLMLVVSLVAPEFLFGALGLRGSTGGTITTLAMRGIMVVGIAGAFFAHRILTALEHIVESVRAGDPFVLDNAARLQAIAWWLLGAELLHLLVGALARLASTPTQPIDIDWNFSFTPWIAVLLLFVLARVFAHGARLREDIEGTV